MPCWCLNSTFNPLFYVLLLPFVRHCTIFFHSEYFWKLKVKALSKQFIQIKSYLCEKNNYMWMKNSLTWLTEAWMQIWLLVNIFFVTWKFKAEKDSENFTRCLDLLKIHLRRKDVNCEGKQWSAGTGAKQTLRQAIASCSKQPSCSKPCFAASWLSFCSPLPGICSPVWNPWRPEYKRTNC